jgi:hypothetical protein
MKIARIIKTMSSPTQIDHNAKRYPPKRGTQSNPNIPALKELNKNPTTTLKITIITRDQIKRKTELTIKGNIICLYDAQSSFLTRISLSKSAKVTRTK